MKTAYATLKGFEVMRMFRKGQFELWYGFYPYGLDRNVRLQVAATRVKSVSSNGNLIPILFSRAEDIVAKMRLI